MTMFDDDKMGRLLELLNRFTEDEFGGSDGTYNSGWEDGYCSCAKDFGLVKWDSENKVWVKNLDVN